MHQGLYIWESYIDSLGLGILSSRTLCTLLHKPVCWSAFPAHPALIGFVIVLLLLATPPGGGMMIKHIFSVQGLLNMLPSPHTRACIQTYWYQQIYKIEDKHVHIHTNLLCINLYLHYLKVIHGCVHMPLYKQSHLQDLTDVHIIDNNDTDQYTLATKKLDDCLRFPKVASSGAIALWRANGASSGGWLRIWSLSGEVHRPVSMWEGNVLSVCNLDTDFHCNLKQYTVSL